MHSPDAAYLAWKWAAFIIYYFVSTKENLYRKILGLSQSMPDLNDSHGRTCESTAAEEFTQITAPKLSCAFY